MASAQGHLELPAGVRYRVFGTAAFAGNPTTVHELDGLPEAEVLLDHSRGLASVDNVYCAPAEGAGDWRLRFFSHSAELRLCGHALLAAAHHLRERRVRGRLRLSTPYEDHECRWRAEAPWVSLPAHAGEARCEPVLEQALAQAGFKREALLLFPYDVWLATSAYPLAVKELDAGAFDWNALEPLAPGALILSARTAPGEYVFRYFSPWCGKPEDSGTGSAHAYLAPCWLAEGEEGLARQWSPLGEARMRVERREGRVWLNGRVERT